MPDIVLDDISSQLDRLHDQIDETVAVLETQWPLQSNQQWEDWPRNFMDRPSGFPRKIYRSLGAYADQHFESVVKGALQIHRRVQEFMDQRPPVPVLEPEIDVEEHEREEKAGSVAPVTAMDRLKTQLLEAIRKELPAMQPQLPPPPAPVPVEVHIVHKDSGPGDNMRWAFGLALSLWVVYNMN